MTTVVPDYLYPGQAFNELGSLVYNMPNFPAIAFDIASLPGSRDAINVAASTIMQSNINPYGE